MGYRGSEPVTGWSLAFLFSHILQFTEIKLI